MTRWWLRLSVWVGLIVVLTGCGSGGGDTSGGGVPVATETTYVQVPVAGPTVYVTPAPSTVTPAEPQAKIAIDFPSPKRAAAHASAIGVRTQVRFVGYDGAGNVRFGPATYPAARQIVLEQVPISVVGLVIEMLDESGAIDDTRHTSVQLQADATHRIDDPVNNGSRVAGLALTPGRASVAQGTSMAFTLHGVFTDGVMQDLTRTASWRCKDTAVANLKSTQTSVVGVVEGIAPGETEVEVTYARRRASSRIVVRDATVTRLEISPAATSLNVDTAVSMTVMAWFADGTLQDVTSDADWSSTTPTVARVLSTPPNSGLVIGIGGGDTEIRAVFGAQSAGATVHVTGAELTAIQVLPALARVSKGLTQQFTARGLYADGSSADLTRQATWSSSNSAIASVASGGSAGGLASGLGVGAATITASYGQIAGATTFEVTDAQVVRLTVTSPRSSVVVGDTTPCTATALFTDGTILDVSSQSLWRSSNSAVAYVVGGIATGVRTGQATVTASYRAMTASAPIAVVTGTANALSISAPTWWVGVSETLDLMSSVLLPDSTVRLLTGETNWTSTAPGTATVLSPGGVVTGVAPGLSTITASHPTYGSVTSPVRVVDRIEQISLSHTGEQLTAATTECAISADGRYVAFRSDSYGVVPGGFNGKSDVYIRDRLLGTVERVSVSADGIEANDYSSQPSMSADGRIVAFWSDSTNLCPPSPSAGPAQAGVYVRDRLNNTTTYLGYATGGHHVSANGRYVIRYSFGKAWRYDCQTGASQQFNVGEFPALTGDGRYMIYEHGTLRQIRLIDLDHPVETELVSKTPLGNPGNNKSTSPSVTPDGRYVVFVSDASDLIANDTNGFTDVYVHDRLTGVTERVSVGDNEEEGNDRSDSDATSNPAISDDGRYVVFASRASNLVAGDTNGARDLFVRDRVLEKTTRLTVPPKGTGTFTPNRFCLSGDGAFVGVSLPGRFIGEGYQGTDLFTIRIR